MTMTFPKKMNAMEKEIGTMSKEAEAVGRQSGFRKIDTRGGTEI